MYKVLIKKLWLLCFIIFLSHNVSAKIYIPIDNTALIKSVDVNQGTAIINMQDYAVKISLDIMKGQNHYRAYGKTPQGMAIGLKYNKTILHLIAIDKAQKNYMSLNFLAKGASQIKLPDEYLSPVSPKELYVSASQFIKSYPLWPADSVARGFDLMTKKEKGIIFLFPAINLEIADKLCRANRITSGIFEILSHQSNLNCDDLLILNNPQKLKSLQSIANQERDLLVNILECGQGRRHPIFCQNINKKLSKKILQTRTISSLLYDQ